MVRVYAFGEIEVDEITMSDDEYDELLGLLEGYEERYQWLRVVWDPHRTELIMIEGDLGDNDPREAVTVLIRLARELEERFGDKLDGYMGVGVDVGTTHSYAI